MSRLDNEDGAALLVALTLVLMLAAAGMAAALTARIETLLAGSFRQSHEAVFTAEGGLARAIQDLSAQPDWSAVLAGAASSFTDGTATGAKRLPGGDIAVLCCGAGSLTQELQQRGNAGRSWGANTPQWRLFAWGAPSTWVAGGRSSNAFYVAVWVADDIHDDDSDPATDANGVVIVHALALGPRNARRSIEADVRHARGADGTPLARGVVLVSSRESRW